VSQKIKITWKAFGDKPEQGRFVSSVEVETEFPETVTDKQICEIVHADTNLYQGYIWQLVHPLLSETRTHTSISVGDEVEINGRVYICADFGFEKIEDVEIKKFGDAVFSVTVKDKVDN
jgi:hypothetical protein